MFAAELKGRRVSFDISCAISTSNFAGAAGPNRPVKLKLTAEKDRRSMSSLAQVLIIKGLERHRAEAVLSVEAVDGMMACTPRS